MSFDYSLSTLLSVTVTLGAISALGWWFTKPTYTYSKNKPKGFSANSTKHDSKRLPRKMVVGILLLTFVMFLFTLYSVIYAIVTPGVHAETKHLSNPENFQQSVVTELVIPKKETWEETKEKFHKGTL